jgi:hypothetical protein
MNTPAKGLYWRQEEVTPYPAIADATPALLANEILFEVKHTPPLHRSRHAASVHWLCVAVGIRILAGFHLMCIEALAI